MVIRKRRVKKRGRADTVKEVSARPGSFAVDLVQELNKNDEHTTAQILGSDGLAIKIRGVISTQCETIDYAIGRGGIPLGRTTVLHGWESSGKTTIALHCAAETQKRGGMVVYIDTEYKLDPDYAKSIGVNTEDLVIVQPPHLEAAFRKIETAIKVAAKYRESGKRLPILIVLDSINSTRAKSVIEGDWDDNSVAAESRVWSSKFPKLIPQLNKEDVALLLISQLRDKIGVVFGPREHLAGGHAPKFYASLILGITKKATIRNKTNEVVGNECEIYVGKNQISPPFKSASFKIMYGKGIDYDDSLLKVAVNKGVVEVSGAWFSVPDYSIDGKPPKYQGEKAILRDIRKDLEGLKTYIYKRIQE